MSQCLAIDLPAPAPLPWRLGPAAGVSVAVLLALSSSDACAAELGSLATSVGLFAALATLFVIKGWPAQLPATALSTATGLLLVAGGAAWLWRARAATRIVRFAGPAPSNPGTKFRAPIRAGLPAPITLPAGFDRAPLLAALRLHFVQLQAAWDRGELRALRALTTPGMLDELCREWPGGSTRPESNRTDVVTLHAELLGFEELAGAFLVSVEFSGLIRESSEQGAAPFRELWMLAKSKHDDSGWRLARQQALL